MKIAICVPLHRQAEGQFLISLSRLLVTTAQIPLNGVPAGLTLEIFSRSSSILPKSRTLLWRAAVDWGADFLLWLDADHVFPPDAFLRLLQRQLPVVAANYATREDEARPTARDLDGHRIFTTDEKAGAGLVEEAKAVGLGFCLIDLRKALPALEQQFGRDYYPLFGLVDRSGSYCGEDYFFCERLREAGLKIHVDHLVSSRVGHLGERVINNTDTLGSMGRETALKTLDLRAKGRRNAGSILPATGDQ